MTTAASAQEKQTILVTTFEPFDGRATNASDVLGNAAAQLLGGSPDSNIDVKICLLPVAFGTAFDVAKACYQSMSPPPKTVISLGEADACQFLLETKAYNGSFIKEKDTEIIKGKPKWLTANLPSEELYCSSTPDEQRRLTVSRTAGSTECNDLMYRMTNFLKGTDVRYGFIHVPFYGPQSQSQPQCTAHPSVQEDAKTLATLLESANDFGREQNNSTKISATPTQIEFPEMNLPLNPDDILSLLKKIKGDDNSAQCRRKILEDLDPIGLAFVQKAAQTPK